MQVVALAGRESFGGVEFALRVESRWSRFALVALRAGRASRWSRWLESRSLVALRAGWNPKKFFATRWKNT